MLISHVLCAVETFAVSADAETGEDRLDLEGWCLSHGAVAAMRLAFAGAPPVAINAHGLASGDVLAMHGDGFGAGAGACRFRHAMPLAGRWPDLASAELHVRFANGPFIAMSLGAELAVRSPGARERRLVASAEPVGAIADLLALRAEAGGEPPSLLADLVSFDLFALSGAVEAGFAAFDRPGTLALAALGGERVVVLRDSGLAFRCDGDTAGLATDQVLRAERARLATRAASFLALCASRASLFVLRVPRGAADGAAIAGARRLAAAIRRHGPARLLMVEDGPDAAIVSVTPSDDVLLRATLPSGRAADGLQARRWAELLEDAAATPDGDGQPGSAA